MVTESVPQGYKQTEIGVIPEDWDVRKLENFEDIRGRVGWKGYTKSDLRISGPYTIGAKHINKENKLDLTNATHLSMIKFLESPEIMVQKDDILIVQRGTIGKLVLIEDEIGNATINPSMIILRTKNISQSFVYYVLLSPIGQKQILLDTSSTGVPMITQKQIGTFKIPFPKEPKESFQIAKVLSETDELIQQLDKLISKKKNIKKGAMQELLTGKKRLPGFSGEWKEKKLGDVSSVFSGSGAPQREEYYAGGKYPFVRVSDLSEKGKTNNLIIVRDYINKKCLIEKNNVLAKKGTIVFPKSGAAVKNNNRAQLGFDAYIVSHLAGVYSTNAQNRFLYYLLSEVNMLDYVGDLGYPSLKVSTIKEIGIMLPPTKEEQTAIAQILSDMDLDIEELERKRDKYKMIKKGMMQQLLTGRIRLKWK